MWTHLVGAIAFVFTFIYAVWFLNTPNFSFPESTNQSCLITDYFKIQKDSDSILHHELFHDFKFFEQVESIIRKIGLLD